MPLERLLCASGSGQLPPHVPYFIHSRAPGQAEMWFGGGRGARNAVAVLFGSGVGAASFSAERLLDRGALWLVAQFPASLGMGQACAGPRRASSRRMARALSGTATGPPRYRTGAGRVAGA
ncbi:hypothetical protein AV521_15115 [Streptomyces sp. IMTB 2501]|nr:hypothetical protein AV521_15115 [Streptomyces sp. IMTB 2501]